MKKRFDFRVQKYLLLVLYGLFLVLSVHPSSAQVKDSFYAGVAFTALVTNNSGSFKWTPSNDPIDYRLTDISGGGEVTFGYTENLSNFILGGEVSFEVLYSKGDSTSERNWTIAYNPRLFDFKMALLVGYAVTMGIHLYVIGGFYPYSRHIIRAEHHYGGVWEDHNFPDGSWGIGSRIYARPIDIRVELFNRISQFEQPAKDDAASRQQLIGWGIKLGIVNSLF